MSKSSYEKVDKQWPPADAAFRQRYLVFHSMIKALHLLSEKVDKPPGVCFSSHSVVLYSRLDGQVPSYLNWCSLPQVERLQVTASHYGRLAVD